jgi:hypothetical protein
MREAIIEETEEFKTPVRVSIVKTSNGIGMNSIIIGEGLAIKITKTYGKRAIGRVFYGTRVTFSDSTVSFYDDDITIYVVGK